MTTRGDNASNNDQLEEEMAQLHKRPDVDEQQDVSPMGYAGNDGVRRSVPGDPESAWLKTPPFESGTQRYVRDIILPNLENKPYLALPPVDVNTRRLLSFWIEFAIPIDEGEGPHRLSILPQGRRDEKTDAWYTIGLVDPTLTLGGVFPVGTGDRVFYQTELSTPVFIGDPAVPIVFRTILTFDVAIYTSFRLSVGSLADEDRAIQALLSIDYSFSN